MKKKRSKFTESSQKYSCAVCWNIENKDEDSVEVEPDYVLRNFNLCKKHKEEIMQCSVCGSQDTTYKTGISKTGKNAGKPWVAYDCNEPQCKNEKGYPNRTFGFAPKSPTGKPPVVASSTLEKKVDKILAILERNFGSTAIEKNIKEPYETPEEDSSPF